MHFLPDGGGGINDFQPHCTSTTGNTYSFSLLCLQTSRKHALHAWASHEVVVMALWLCRTRSDVYEGVIGEQKPNMSTCPDMNKIFLTPFLKHNHFAQRRDVMKEDHCPHISPVHISIISSMKSSIMKNPIEASILWWDDHLLSLSNASAKTCVLFKIRKHLNYLKF